MGFFSTLFSNNQPEKGNSKKQLSQLYMRLGYKIIPFLPNEEESTNIIEDYNASIHSALVSKDYMEPDSNGLLRGDIVLLWWISNPRTKLPFPQYFIYEYGVNANERANKLERMGLVNSDHTELTSLGQIFLSNNEQIIREHKALKLTNEFGKTEYKFSDAKSVENESTFKSTGDFIDDQFKGKAFEQAGDLEAALAAYQSAYKLSLKQDPQSSPPPNVFTRQAIIYRKQKRYDKEIEILQLAGKHGYGEHFSARLKKANELLEKAQK